MTTTLDSSPSGEALTWTRTIPIVNNRYVWVHWGWAALLIAALVTATLGTLLAVVLPVSEKDLAVYLRMYALVALLTAGVVLAFGLFAALAVTNSVSSRFTLNAGGASASVESYSGVIISALSLLGAKSSSSTSFAGVMGMLLPESGGYQWQDVRRVEFDDQRHVITLHRGWHRLLRVYATPENYDEASAWVKRHMQGATLPSSTAV